ncbi:hypothetical protein, partial [Ruthenibacterium lactatiformans]|uniref:hypothetical protein n=1 Tax=Ruthenibacterium lactatiformans TaxID=1550024 RepID=UPI0030B9BA81|nr:hypothetical protein [Ruthenibacterium lactatiformans]
MAGNVLAGVLYAALGVAGLLLLCGKGLRVTPEECRLAPVRLRPVWAASAVLMPALAAGALLCQPGKGRSSPRSWTCGPRRGRGHRRRPA